MQDRYLFRGKRLSDGKWMHGNLICKESDDLISVFIENMRKDDWHEVDPATVGQCTGLKDKNGRLIFEGDEVSVRYMDNGEEAEEPITVVWDSNKCSFSPWTWIYQCDGCECGVELMEIEVISNIHDKREVE